MHLRTVTSLRRTLLPLAALALGLLGSACTGADEISSDQGAAAGGPPPPGEQGGDDEDYPEKPPHQLCTADLQDFLAHGVQVEDLEEKIEHGLELGVTSLPLLATDEELAQLREQGISQELLDKWSKPVEGGAAAAPAPAEGAAPAPAEGAAPAPAEGEPNPAEAAPPAPPAATP